MTGVQTCALPISDNLMVLDSNLFSKGVIDIEFRDRGIVEYFIDSMLEQEISYNIKIRISKERDEKQVAINRLKKLLAR